jgi:hypothetical protein
LNFRVERFGIANRLLFAYVFGRPKSEQNSSHARRAPMSELSAQDIASYDHSALFFVTNWQVIDVGYVASRH